MKHLLIAVAALAMVCSCATHALRQPPTPTMPSTTKAVTVRKDLRLEVNAEVMAMLDGKNTNDNMHFSSMVDLVTNTALVPAVDRSFIGDTGGGMGALFAPNMAIGNLHTLAGSLLFTAQDGQQFRANVTKVIRMDPTDFAIEILESNMPPCIKPAWIMPPNYDVSGMLGFWVSNTRHDIHLGVFEIYQTGALGLNPVLTNDFGVGEWGRGEGSTSPAFTVMVVDGKPVPVIMFDTSGANPDGWPPFHSLIWPHIPTNGLQIVNLSGYKAKYVPPTIDRTVPFLYPPGAETLYWDLQHSTNLMDWDTVSRDAYGPPSGRVPTHGENPAEFWRMMGHKEPTPATPPPDPPVPQGWTNLPSWINDTNETVAIWLGTTTTNYIRGWRVVTTQWAIHDK